jgi:SOS-response transcriptional repressor LexA
MKQQIEKRPITPRTREWYDRIVAHYRKHGYGMNYRELSRAFGSTNPNAAVYHLKILFDRGYVTHTPGRANSIIPVQGDA